jgi:hypothetical protein
MPINFIDTCPDCGSKQIRTVTTFDEGIWKWLNGCNICTWEQVVGNVGDE